MSSVPHEVLVEIVRQHPEHVLGLLRAAFGVTYGGAVEVVEAAENLTHIPPPERRADAVLLMRTPGQSRPLRALVVEVQLRRDARKRLSWPVYVAVLRARYRCPVTLVVITLDAATARWCARPIDLDDHGSALPPLVIGPSQVPLLDPDNARRDPELGLLSLLAHRHEPAALDLGRALLVACDTLDDEHARLYADLALASLSQAARHALEAEMNLKHYELRSPFLRNLVAQGTTQGRIEALVGALMKVLEARGLAVTAAQRTAIEACEDSAQLDAWLVQAVSADSADELFPQ